MKAEPAFPVQSTAQATYGMALRDYFAAKAMNGLLANIDDRDMRFVKGADPSAVIAQISYKMADAMLKAREEQ
jgi:hypothetical protein